MTGLRFEKTDKPEDKDLKQILKNLRAFNRSKGGVYTQQPVAVFVRDADNSLIGGATGEVTWGWLYVDMLWVEEHYRGTGVGARLLSDLEKMADGYDVIGYHLSTTSFQALDFYRHCGYEIWGELPDFPPGFTNYALRKLRR